MLNPFPHTTILQQTTLNIFCQKIENLYNWMDNLWLKVENIVAKGEIACFEQFFLLSLCFQKAVCCRGVRKHLYEGKSLSIYYFSTYRHVPRLSRMTICLKVECTPHWVIYRRSLKRSPQSSVTMYTIMDLPQCTRNPKTNMNLCLNNCTPLPMSVLNPRPGTGDQNKIWMFFNNFVSTSCVFTTWDLWL